MIDWQDQGEHDQRRKYSRRAVKLPVRLRVGVHEIIAVTENISAGGAFLRVELPAGESEVIASIDLPQGRRLHVRAKVRWRRPQPPGVGLEFETFLVRPNESDLAEIS